MKQTNKKITRWMLIALAIFMGLPSIVVLHALLTGKRIADIVVLLIMFSVVIGMLVIVGLYLFMFFNDILGLDELHQTKIPENIERLETEAIPEIYKESSHGLALDTWILFVMIAGVAVYCFFTPYFPDSILFSVILALIAVNIACLALCWLHNRIKKSWTHRNQSFKGWEEWKNDRKQEH